MKVSETIIGIIFIAGVCLALFIFFRKPGENLKDTVNIMKGESP
jgi:hypothetical protein